MTPKSAGPGALSGDDALPGECTSVVYLSNCLEQLGAGSVAYQAHPSCVLPPPLGSRSNTNEMGDLLLLK